VIIWKGEEFYHLNERVRSIVIMKRVHSILNIFILLLMLRSTDGQSYQSLVHMSDLGMQFIPIHPIECLGSIAAVKDTNKCFQYCNLNILCWTFVYDSITMACTLYEGLVETGSILPSSSMTMITGGIDYTEDLFISYGETCDKCYFNRYLQCSNISVCSCSIHSFFYGSICRNQFYYTTCRFAQQRFRVTMTLAYNVPWGFASVVLVLHGTKPNV
jgi:hypothetical protein